MHFQSSLACVVQIKQAQQYGTAQKRTLAGSSVCSGNVDALVCLRNRLVNMQSMKVEKYEWCVLAVPAAEPTLTAVGNVTSDVMLP